MIERIKIIIELYKPNFKTVEFDGFRKNAGLHIFTLSVTEWCEKTNAMGMYSKMGKYKIIRREK